MFANRWHWLGFLRQSYFIVKNHASALDEQAESYALLVLFTKKT